MSDTKKNRDYDAMSPEELEQRFREAFFWPDQINETIFRELEQLRETLEEKRPQEDTFDPDAAWERFLEDRGEELETLWGPAENAEAADRAGQRKGFRRFPALLRAGLAAAVLLVLLAGAALAAGPRLLVWVRGWSDEPAVYVSPGADTEETPIARALEELGITEPVYPSYLPSDYVLTEAHISEDPLLLYELYTRGDRYISITITSVTAVEKALYAQVDPTLPEYTVGEAAHYIFSNGGYVTAVWYTENCFVSISGNITTRPMKRIIDSVYAK